jgi:ribosome-binding factor A
MRISSKLSTIKTAQKESAILRILSTLFEEAIRENQELQGWYATRVQLSQGKSVAYVYIYSEGSTLTFSAILEKIKIYKPSMRKALATELQKRYTPDIVFVFDEQLKKTLHMERLLDLVKNEAQDPEEPT